MKLKCIGGERDGELFEIDIDRYRLHDSVRIPEKSKLTNFKFTPGEIPNVMYICFLYLKDGPISKQFCIKLIRN